MLQQPAARPDAIAQHRRKEQTTEVVTRSWRRRARDLGEKTMREPGAHVFAPERIRDADAEPLSEQPGCGTTRRFRVLRSALVRTPVTSPVKIGGSAASGRTATEDE